MEQIYWFLEIFILFFHFRSDHFKLSLPTPGIESPHELGNIFLTSDLKYLPLETSHCVLRKRFIQSPQCTSPPPPQPRIETAHGEHCGV